MTGERKRKRQFQYKVVLDEEEEEDGHVNVLSFDSGARVRSEGPKPVSSPLTMALHQIGTKSSQNCFKDSNVAEIQRNIAEYSSEVERMDASIASMSLDFDELVQKVSEQTQSLQEHIYKAQEDLQRNSITSKHMAVTLTNLLHDSTTLFDLSLPKLIETTKSQIKEDFWSQTRDKTIEESSVAPK